MYARGRINNPCTQKKGELLDDKKYTSNVLWTVGGAESCLEEPETAQKMFEMSVDVQVRNKMPTKHTEHALTNVPNMNTKQSTNQKTWCISSKTCEARSIFQICVPVPVVRQFNSTWCGAFKSWLPFIQM